MIITQYYKSFSIIPRRIDGKWIWLKDYYRKYELWIDGLDHIGNITTEEYLVRKLADNL